MSTRATMEEERGEEIRASPTYNPEYTRRRCRLCGSFYMTAGKYIDVGLCKYCAKMTGWLTTPKIVGITRNF